MKIHQVRGELCHADREIERRTDKHDKVNSCLYNFTKSPNKKLQVSNYGNEFCNVVSKIEKNNRNCGFVRNKCCYYERSFQISKMRIGQSIKFYLLFLRCFFVYILFNFRESNKFYFPEIMSFQHTVNFYGLIC